MHLEILISLQRKGRCCNLLKERKLINVSIYHTVQVDLAHQVYYIIIINAQYVKQIIFFRFAKDYIVAVLLNYFIYLFQVFYLIKRVLVQGKSKCKNSINEHAQLSTEK